MGNDRPALMMAGLERSESMTIKEFHEKSMDCLVSWFYELHLLLKGDRQVQKIEPMQKRQLISTAQSLLHDMQDALDSDLTGSDK